MAEGKSKRGFWDFLTGKHTEEPEESATPTPTPVPDPDQDFVNEWAHGFGSGGQRKGKK